jgi:predicted NAD/FAD-binding protein
MGLISNGTTVFDAGAMSLGGSMTFIKKLTASSSSTLSFVDGASSVVLDSTYKEYLFTFKNIHPQTDGQQFKFQTSIDGGSNYATTITSTYFIAYHKEDNSETALSYGADDDQAQTTNFTV